MRRLAAPASLLLAEYGALSLAVDFPSSGPAMALVGATKLLVPVALGAGAAGVLLARHGDGGALRELRALPAPRPLPALLLHLMAFAVTAALGHRLMGPRATPMAPGAFAAWLACVALTIVLAVAVVAQPLALARVALRRLGAPLFAAGVGLLAWRAVAAVEQLWGPLQAATLGATGALLRAAARDVAVRPAEAILGVGGFEVQVAPVCSGVDGVGLVTLFLAVWIALARTRVRVGRALLIVLPVGAAAAWGANILRIAVLVLLGASGREELALGAFHSKLGWLLFLAIAFAGIAVAEHARWLAREVAPAAAEGLPPETAAYVGPLLAALITALATSLWSAGSLDAWYGARVATAALVMVLARRTLPRLALAPSWVPFALAAAVCALWIPFGGAARSTLAHELAQLAPGPRLAWIAVRLVGACVVLPVAEELAFRGFLLPWLMAPRLEAVQPQTWSWPAILISSAAFGAVHDQWLLGTAAGVVFAVARLWRNRLGDAIVAHAACNAGLSAAVLLGGRWELWG